MEGADRDSVHVGIKVPSRGALASSDALSRTARLAERCGFDSVWVSDHVVMPVEMRSEYPFRRDGRPPFDPATRFQDPFVALAYLAAVTSSVRLGIGVLLLPLGHPFVVAKQAATLDLLSGGRLILGVGVGWMREEFELLGQHFSTRGERTDAGIVTLRASWSDDPIDFRGAASGPGSVAMAPKPRQGASLPVWVGGDSSAAPARAVRLGDGWFGSNVRPGAYAGLAGEVRRRRRNVLPDKPMTLGIKVPVSPPRDARWLCDAYTAAGADIVVFDMDMERITLDGACDVIEQMAEVLELEPRDEPVSCDDGSAISQGIR